MQDEYFDLNRATDYAMQQAQRNIDYLANYWMAQNLSRDSRKENFALGEIAAENADKRTRNLYQDIYSPKAKMQQLKEAGLSPALFGDLAGSSGAGQAGAQGTGAAGIHTTSAPITPMEIANMRLMEAQTKKIEAETQTEKGENARGMSEIANNLAEAGAKEASKSLLEAQEMETKLDIYLKDKTKEFNISRAEAIAQQEYYRTRQAGYEAEEAGLKLSYDLESYQSRLQEQFARVNEIISQTNMNNEHKEYFKEKCKQIQESIYQEWAKVANEKATWKTYDELVATQCQKLQAETATEQYANYFKERGQTLNFVSALIGSAAHVAGVAMKK